MPNLIDVRYALRLLARSPAFTLLTVIVLTGGLALSIYTYSFLNSLMFKPVPLPDGDRVVKLYGEKEGQRQLLDAYELAQVRRDVKGLTQIGAYTESSVLLSGRDSSRSLLGSRMEWGFLDFTQTKPLLGRGFMPDDNADNAEPVAIIGHKLWQSMFASDPKVIDTLVQINSVQTRIIGVMPEGFTFPVSSDLWLPLTRSTIDASRRGIGSVSAYARIAEDSSEARASVELASALQGLTARAQVDPKDLPDGGFVVSYPKAQMGDAMPLFVALYIVAAFIFLLAVTNVGNLLLSRANERARETSIRVALGAPRRQLIVQMMWESILICSIGGLLAVLLAGWALELTNLWARGNFEDGLAYWWHWGMDGNTLFASLVIIALTILLAGGIPAWRATGGDFLSVLRDGSRGGQGRRAGRLTRTLVVLEIVLISVVMFIGSVLAVAAHRAAHVERGVDMRNLMVGSVELPADRYTENHKKLAFYDQLAARLPQEPGIQSVVLMATLGDSDRVQFAVDGSEYKLESDYPETFGKATSGSLEPMGIRLIDGRYFDSRDTDTGMKAVIVSESLARRYFNGEALGKRLRFIGLSKDTEWRTVVGIVSDVLDGEPMSRNASTIGAYVPFSQAAPAAARVIFRHGGDVASARGALFRTLHGIDSTVVANSVASYEEMVRKVALLATSVTDLFIKCGLFALLLAVTGVYTLIANAVTQRTQEIGVWRALGATDGRVIRTFMGQGARLLTIGLGIGFVFALLAGLVFSRVLAISPVVYLVAAVAVPVLISLIVLIATYIPTRRSVQMEPIAALRYE